MKIHNKIDKGLEKYNTNKPNKTIIHHTGGTDKNPLADTSHHTFETVYHWHKYGRNWTTIGYHFFIDITGKITQGRPVSMHGAHCKGENNSSIGICLAGNFDATTPSEAQTSSLRALLKKLVSDYNIPKTEIFPHRKFSNKTCYGNNLDDDWAKNLLAETCSLSQYSINELFAEIISRITK